MDEEVELQDQQIQNSNDMSIKKEYLKLLRERSFLLGQVIEEIILLIMVNCDEENKHWAIKR